MREFMTTVLLLAVAAIVASHYVPSGEPTWQSLAVRSDASVVDKAAARLAMVVVSWEVHDYFVFKTATANIAGEELVLVTTPFSGGKWHKL